MWKVNIAILDWYTEINIASLRMATITKLDNEYMNLTGMSCGKRSCCY